tara:strand:+ start:2193 stop:2525 length:333 start_codon:yes stop_codon:yes gene_type:complete
MTEAVASSEPEVTVIVASPIPVAVTNPESETATTDSSDVAQTTSAPLISLPILSFGAIVSWTSSPNAEKLKAVSDNSKLAVSWETSIGAVVVTEPEDTVRVAVPFATEVN